jgi:1-acyl-sn-glycerol-3-phosphate acyltransferase
MWFLLCGGRHMTATERIVNFIIKGILRLACRVDDSQLVRVPEHGPLIVVTNHVTFLEVPMLYTHMIPRRMTGFAKAESWDNPLIGWLFDVWRAIPLKRGEADVSAMRAATEVLKDGGIIGLAPEGTRSGHGRLLRAHPGVVLLAQWTNAPLIPVVHTGGEDFKRNLARLRRTDFKIIVGNPFHIHFDNIKKTSEIRHVIVDEIMYQLAALLPAKYRGVYADLSAATEKYLRFTAPSQSNLLRARS